MYDILGHGSMIADRVRTEAYAAAIRQIVRPGSVVLDVGTGTGIMAMMACRAGARRVFAVELNEVIDVARELVAVNGMSDRIELLHASSTEITLPERVDVIVSDVRGVLPMFTTSLHALRDACARHLAPGGVMMPRVEWVRMALVESPATWERQVAPWTAGADGFDLTPVLRMAVSNSRKVYLEPHELLSEPETWTTIDHSALTPDEFAGTSTLVAARDGVAHGFTLWFDTELADGIGFSNAPTSPRTIYGQVFVPFERPIDVQRGDALTIDLAARFTADQDYLWRWTTSRGATELFRQSTFFATPQKKL